MSSPEKVSKSQFWTSINIWIKNSHVVNRRLSGVNTLTSNGLTVSKQVKNLIIKELCGIDYALIASSHAFLITNVLLKLNQQVKTQNVDLEKYFVEIKSDHNAVKFNVVIIVQKLICKGNKYRDGFRISVIDLDEIKAVFINKFSNVDLLEPAPDIPYSIQWKDKDIVLNELSGSDVTKNRKTSAWLQDTLLIKLKKWATNKSEHVNIVDGSLNLVSLDKYNLKYQELKIKYGLEMVKVWPECTDPSKFVYEDVAIATYLLLLWENERKRQNKTVKQSFVDLGCGNGLLVYILASEGHDGKGIDVRKRDIWDLYPEFVKLEVDSITPSAEYLYKNTDWIIGNHSDELTPWIPVIAARSSYNTNFFLLPCCAYELSGKKYQRSDSSKSQYGEYIEYIRDVCKECGIKTQVDRLKIPSTKRVCLIGTDRLFEKEYFPKKIEEIKKFIDKRCDNFLNNKQTTKAHDCWVPDFTPRESVEKVRNCTKIDKRIVNEIIDSVTVNLLKEKNYHNSKWNAGGCVSLNEIVKILPSDKLKILKRECGGLQTLLRNHHHIFEVVAGRVKLRYPRTRSEVFKQLSEKQSKTKKVKKEILLNKKPCWFHSKHPDGCPLSEDECSYMH